MKPASPGGVSHAPSVIVPSTSVKIEVFDRHNARPNRNDIQTTVAVGDRDGKA